MPKTLFICHANVARSQMAEAYYNHLTNSDEGFSAGVSKRSPVDYPVLPQELIDLMLEEGIDMHNQRPKTVTEEIVKKSDRIFVLCTRDECPGFLKNSKKAVFWDIEDPYRLSFDEMRNIRDLIKSKVMHII